MKSTIWRWIVPVAAASAALAADPALTIYNQDFAVVRETVHLDLAAGLNRMTFAETTAHLEPDSVILRDPAGERTLRVVEQNYRGDPVSQELLLSMFEGKTIDFLLRHSDEDEIVPGRIVRSGYIPHYFAMGRYGPQYSHRQMAYSQGGMNQPIIEIDGKLRFGLPGIPLFPELADDAILKPTLHWLLETDRPGPVDAELAYISGGMRWEADYNIIAPEKGDRFDLVGWVTIDNQCGKTFEDARIKLIAGDVNKIQPADSNVMYYGALRSLVNENAGSGVTEKAFDEYHLYSLGRKTTIRDRETKQVEFIRAAGVRAERIYVYDGAKLDDQRYRGWSVENYRTQADYGTLSNNKVWAMFEFENSKQNRLGMPLPGGRLRFYRQDDDGLLEFTGEDTIDHTARDETVRVYTGNAFDLVGERKRTDYQLDSNRRQLDETFEVKVRNRKDEPAEIRVVEHLYRWNTWEITATSHELVKTDSRTIEFRVPLQPGEEETIRYTAHYTW